MKVLSLRRVSKVHRQARRNLHHLVLSVSFKINSYCAINVLSLANFLDKGNSGKENSQISFQEIQQLMTTRQIKKIIGVQIQSCKELLIMTLELCQATSLTFLSICYCIDSGTRFQSKLKKRFCILIFTKACQKKNKSI